MERIWERTGDDELLRWVFEALGVGRGFSLGYKIEVSPISHQLLESRSGRGSALARVDSEGAERDEADLESPSSSSFSISQVLHLLLSLFLKASTPDYFSITQIHIQLNEPALSSALLQDLLKPKSSETEKEKEKRILIAYQVGFDLAEGATQEYLAGVEKGVVGEEGEKEVSNYYFCFRDKGSRAR